MAVTAVHSRAVALRSFLLGGKQQSAVLHLAEPSFGPAPLALNLLVSGNKNRLATAHRLHTQVACDPQQVAGRLSAA